MKYLHQILGWLFGIGLLSLYIFYFFDWQTTKALLLKTKITMIVLFIAAFYTGVLIRFVKWTFLIRMDSNVPWKNGYHTIMIANMVNYLSPLRFGELLKLYLINRLSATRYVTSLSATLTDRVSQLTAILAFVCLTPFAGYRFSQWSSKFAVFLVIFVTGLIIVFIIGPRTLTWIEYSMTAVFRYFGVSVSRIHRFFNGRMVSFFRETLEKINISSFKRRHLILIFVFSLATILTDGLAYYFLLKGFNIQITWLQGALAGCFMCLTFILPTPPGQIGTAEMYPVLIFSYGLGHPNAVISSAALLMHLLILFILVILGLLSLFFLKMDLKSLLKSLREKQIHVRS